MTNTLPDIFAYSDYRAYLAEYFRARSARDRAFSQAYICRKLGLPNSRSFFADVIRGRKPLTPSKTEAMIALLELEEDQAAHFRTLVLHNQSALPSEKGYHLERLVASSRSPAAALDRKSFEYYRTWYHGTVRALLDVLDIDKDPSPLAARIVPAVPLPRIRQSLALLKKLGLIRRNEAGFWKPSEQSIHSGSYLQDEIVKQYQIQCLDIAKAAIAAPDGPPRNISTLTLSVSDKAYRRIEQKLQEFKSEIRALVAADRARPERVYQLNVHLFPQSK
jgi:uncharacterized protein (TIGR02147 family)